MKNLYKYILLYTVSAITIISVLFAIDSVHQQNLSFHESTLMQQTSIKSTDQLSSPIQPRIQEHINVLNNSVFILNSLSVFFILLITFFLHKAINHSINLNSEIKSKVNEINSTKKLLQEILDGDLSFLFVANDNEIIYTNKTVLDFFGFSTLSDFKIHYPSISDIFEKTEDNGFLQRYVNDEHWTEYLKREQEHKNVQVLIKKDGKDKYFKAHTKEIIIDDQILYLVIFDEITREFKRMQELEENASIDSLTKLFNRGKFDTVLNKEIDLCKSTNIPLSIIFIDIDHFKKVNDTYGHEVGDEVLIDLSNLLNENTRKGDFVFRWGGEEFAITLKSANKIQATVLAEKIRKAVQSHIFNGIPTQTISLGVTQYKDDDTQETFIKRVDEALYKAKESGRNMVTTD